MSNTAFIDHVVSQIATNVDFLVSQGHLSHSDANTIKSKLPNSNPRGSAISMPTPVRSVVAPPPPAPSSAQAVYARAIWSYNENGEDPNDLSFSAGDIITIVAETNDDWWTGEHNGRKALFPANYVEKVDAAIVAAPARSLPPSYSASGVSSASEKKPYKPFMAAHYDAPPPTSSATNTVGLQQDNQGQEKKKSKFGKYGNTMAQSAAGGVGFGAGAAIGGGLVRAIF